MGLLFAAQCGITKKSRGPYSFTHRKRDHAPWAGELYSRDFMWYNERLGAQEWFYALPRDADLDGAADWMKTCN